MSQITFKDWKLAATTEGADILRLNVEALDGSDIIEVGYQGESAGREGEPYLLRLSTEKLEAAQRVRPGGANDAEATTGEAEDETGQNWLADDEETLYTRGWEITALVDEDGVLSIEVGRQDDAEFYALEPIESGTPLAPHVTIRLAAEEEIEDEDEDEGEEDEEDFDTDMDTLDEGDELDEFDDYDDLDEDEDEEMVDLFDDEDGRY